MRLFMKQQNVIETSPVRNVSTGEIVDTLNITFKVYDLTDALVPDSDISLGYDANGVYRGTCPMLEELVNNDIYNVELRVLNGATPVWYFKGPARAIIRSTLE